MDFRSDNVASVAPAILDAISAAGRRSDTPYGDDALGKRVQARFAEIFERDVVVLPVVTGTIANALSISLLTPPWGVIYTGDGSHTLHDECGAPELFSGGAKVTPVAETAGKIDLAALKHKIAAAGKGVVHNAQPACISLTQASETGAVYSAGEVGAVGDMAAEFGLGFHMDGARFANAAAASSDSPADMTWRAGVDALSFGATKNGAFAAEAIVLFRTEKADELTYRHKRAGQLLSKMRLISAQLDAYLEGGLWLTLAAHANKMAQDLIAGLGAIPQTNLEGPGEANEVFVSLPRTVIGRLRDAGYRFYDWPETEPETTTIRLVTRHDNTADEIAALLASIREFCAAS